MVNFRDFQQAKSAWAEDPCFEKDFRGWFDKKSEIEYQTINHHSGPKNPKKRDIWDIFLGHNVGKEVCGKEKYTRPVLILQRWGDVCLVVALTTWGKDDRYHLPLSSFIGKNAEPSRVKLSSLTTISLKRCIYKMWVVSSDEFQKITDGLSELTWIGGEINNTYQNKTPILQ